MSFQTPLDRLSGITPRKQWLRGAGVAMLWLICAWLTQGLFAFMPNQSVYPIWPADAIALGFVLIWGHRVIAPLLMALFVWDWVVVDRALLPSLLSTLALGLGFLAALFMRHVLQRLIPNDYGRRLLGFPLTVLMLSSVITVLGIWKNPQWTAHYQTVGLFWLAESIALLAFTPLVMACLHEGCQPLIAQLSKTARHYAWLAIWLVLALLSLGVIAGLRHWGALDFNAPSLLGLVVVVLAAHSLPVLVARMLIAGYLTIWSVLNVLITTRAGWESSQLMGDQTLVFVAALLAVIAIEMVQAYRLSEQKLAQRLHTDPLTGLPNDLGLAKQLAHWPKEANGAMQPMVVIGIHLPDLEEIDALMGHERSNRIEEQVSRVFVSIGMRSSVARVRPGLFVACLSSVIVGARGADLAEQLRARIEMERNTTGGSLRHMRVGLTVFHRAQTRDIGLLTSAVLAGCRLSLAHRNHPVHVEDDLACLLDQRVAELSWVQRMRATLNGDMLNGQFILYAQTIRDTRHPDVKSFEVLLRWQEPNGEIIPPAGFLPIAERYGLMTLIDLWVLQTTLTQLAASPWVSAISKVSINLSGASLMSPSLPRDIASALNQSGCRPEQICFEITETMVIADTATARQAVLSIKAMGCKISLDDFGTGLSTFSYLKRFPFDYLKIDGEFIRHITESRIDRAIVESIQAIAFEMNTDTVAEFVENNQQIEVLRQIGVYYHQGYGIAKPMPIHAFLIP
jgi:EAL domain-containing protein (putative c-di-GMP-specific phosphodiesterase class I)/GGDEF domain-containing protein